MRTSPLPSPCSLRAAAFLVCAACGAVRLPADESHRLAAPPGFSQANIAARADEVVRAAEQWDRSDQKLEQRIFRLPMSEAREQLRASLTAFLDFLAARSSYAETVAVYLDSRSLAGSLSGVPDSAVCQDEIGTLGSSLAALQARLTALRDSPQWLVIRRSLREPDREALERQSALRARLDITVLPSSRHPSPVISPPAYRDAQRALTETLRRLWTAYYQALADAVEQKPTLPLIPLRHPEGVPQGTPAARLADRQSVELWTYVEGSQQFNGVAEPKHVMLELWTENGSLMGRYRAELPGFRGTQTVDLRLRGVPSTGPSQTLNIQSKDPDAAGQIVLERAGFMGALMLVRMVPARSSVPRGRELLRRQ